MKIIPIVTSNGSVDCRVERWNASASLSAFAKKLQA